MAGEEGGQVHSLNKIRVLPGSVAEKIAAGEVVERPASVVKELVENAIDAGARRVEVELEEGGKRLIRVSDDGCGMSREDAELAFARHATSKLPSGMSLDNIATLGFRGEALPSIAAVSKVDLTTRRRGLPGVRVEVSGGKVVEVREAGAPAGTTVVVRDIFITLPARLKFLKSAGAELGHVTDFLTRIALAYPEVGLWLCHQGREVLKYLPVSEPLDRVRQVFGNDRARQLRVVSYARGGIGITGAVAGGGLSFSSSRYVFTFVNRRPVRDRSLNHALLEGFGDLMPKGRQPAAVLKIELSPSEVDVNVHPAKQEVRFLHGRWVHDAVVSAVRQALSIKGASQPDGGEGRVEERLRRYIERVEPASLPFAASPPVAGRSVDFSQPSLPVREASPAGQPLAHGGYSSLRFVGQVFDGYLLCEGDEKLVLIDQHAAHERVMFEGIKEQYQAGNIEQQALLVPETVNLGPAEAEALTAHQAELSRFGFDMEFFGGNSFLVRAVPAVLNGCDSTALLDDIAACLVESGSSAEARGAADHLIATMACHSAVRAGQKMLPQEACSLLEQLDRLDFSTNCPHGRPVALEFTRGRLERLFGR